MDKFEREHAKYVALMQKRMQDILDSYEREITRLAGAVTADPGRPFRFADYPALKARYDKLIKDMEAELQQAVESGVKNEWGRADRKNDALAIGVVGSVQGAAARGCLRRNDEALTAFIDRKAAGMTLSDRVWMYTNQYDAQIQAAIDVALLDGRSAAELSRDVRSYLVHPDTLFRRVRDERGVLHLSKNAKAFHPGQGVYRSAYMNARRMAATEINMAYRTSDYMRIQQMDFVVGIEVHLSGNHNCKGIPPGQFFDICDELQGKYPKTFKFTGWHPHCYDDKSEVYTDSGWKLFKDVEDSDLILSLDPKTRDLEYVPILLNISRPHKGKMVHFHNRSYSQLVTPEHEVLYVSKGDNETFKRVEADKCGKTQPIYRSCEWVGEDVSVMSVGGLKVPFVLFAEFMGYWLADGSLGHKYEVGIAQQDDNRKNIYACIERIGMRPRYNGGKVEFNNREFYEYLKQFGKAAEKYVPAEIKESAKESICAFLDAFISCDGHIKKPKPFVGSRGSLCVPKEGERVYCTTSRRMADDIGELVLKKGARPSFSINRTAGKMQRFKNGIYRINYDIITIRECRSQFATQYSKDYVDYDGIVYDLTLAKNNTMYIRREGKCFWGSNCRCYTTTILKSREEMKADAARLKEGKSPSKAENSPQAVTTLPDNFTKWLADNQQRVATARRLPYFLKDNGRMEGDVWVPFQKVLPLAKPTLLELAAQRHAARTPEQVQAIKDKWEARSRAIDSANNLETEYGGILDFDSAKYGGYEGKWAQYQKAVEAYKAELDKRFGALPLLDDPKGWAKKFTLNDLDKVQAAVEAKLGGWNAMGYSLQKTKDKLDFEIDWIEKNKKYNTWEVASGAYKKELAKVETAIKWHGYDDEYNKLFAYQATKTTDAFKKHLKAYQTAKAAGDETAALAAIDRANKLIERWEKASSKAKYDRSDIIKLYSDTEKAEYERLLKEFEDALKADGGNHRGYNARSTARRFSDYVAKLGELHNGEVKFPHIGGKTDDEVNAAIAAYLGVKKPKSYTFSSPVGGSFEKGYDHILDPYSSRFGIPKDELSLITRYTKGSGFINDYKYQSAGWNYTKTVLKKDNLDELVKILDDYEVAANGVLDKMPKYNADTYRGVNFYKGGRELLAELQDCVANGKNWTCPSLMSTATDINVTGIFGSDMTILIRGKSGVDVRQVSHFDGGESEVLFRSGSKFKVVSVRQVSEDGIAMAGCWEVILEEVF